jgi:hypothetical protein
MDHGSPRHPGTARQARQQYFDDLEQATEEPPQSELVDDRHQPSQFQAQYDPVGVRSLLGGALAVTAIKALNASTGVNELLLAGEERVALVTKFKNLLT